MSDQYVNELERKCNIATAALKAIRERVYNSDAWIDKPLSDCGIAATNALIMMGEYDYGKHDDV